MYNNHNIHNSTNEEDDSWWETTRDSHVEQTFNPLFANSVNSSQPVVNSITPAFVNRKLLPSAKPNNNNNIINNSTNNEEKHNNNNNNNNNEIIINKPTTPTSTLGTRLSIMKSALLHRGGNNNNNSNNHNNNNNTLLNHTNEDEDEEDSDDEEEKNTVLAKTKAALKQNISYSNSNDNNNNNMRIAESKASINSSPIPPDSDNDNDNDNDLDSESEELLNDKAANILSGSGEQKLSTIMPSVTESLSNNSNHASNGAASKFSILQSKSQIPIVTSSSNTNNPSKLSSSDLFNKVNISKSNNNMNTTASNNFSTDFSVPPLLSSVKNNKSGSNSVAFAAAQAMLIKSQATTGNNNNPHKEDQLSLSISTSSAISNSKMINTNSNTNNLSKSITSLLSPTESIASDSIISPMTSQESPLELFSPPSSSSLSILSKYPVESIHSPIVNDLLQAKHNSEILEEASIDELVHNTAMNNNNTTTNNNNNNRTSIKSPDRSAIVKPVGRGSTSVSNNNFVNNTNINNNNNNNNNNSNNNTNNNIYNNQANLVPGLNSFNFPVPSSSAEFNRIILGLDQYFDQLLSNCSKFLSLDITQDLRSIRSKLHNIDRTMESEGTAVASNDTIEILTSINKNQWRFNLVNCAGYRISANMFSHSKYFYSDWHFPQYIGTQPIPSTAKTINCNIRIPVLNSNGEIINNNSNNHIIKVLASINDTVADIIHRVITLYNEKQTEITDLLDEDSSEYVLKVCGYNEYLEGLKFLFQYEYIRYAVRNMQQCELFMLSKPNLIEYTQEDLEQFNLNQINYKNKIVNIDPSLKSNIQPITIQDYQEYSHNKPFETIKYFQLSELKTPWAIKISGLDRCNQVSLPKFSSDAQLNSNLYIKILLIHGLNKINSSQRQTELVKSNSTPRWEQWLYTSIQGNSINYNQIPPQSRLVCLIYCKILEKQELIGYTIVNFINQFGQVLQGKQEFGIWGIELKDSKDKEDLTFIYRSPPIPNNSNECCLLTVEFPSFALPLVNPLIRRSEHNIKRSITDNITQGYININDLNKENKVKLDKLIKSDSLYNLTAEESGLIWACRLSLIEYPEMLPKFLLTIDWTESDQVIEAYRLLKLWSPPIEPRLILELLDIKYPDYVVRSYAVKLLSTLNDDEFSCYLLQLTQILKYEQYHNNPLTRLLISRSLQSPMTIGHYFFWSLKAESHLIEYSERFSLILEEYLSYAGPHSIELTKQYNTVQKLQRVAEMIVKFKLENKYSDAECMKEYAIELEKLNNDWLLPQGKFQIPLNPKLEATTLIVEKCRFMSSKKVPLWLVFRNADLADTKPIYIIFKSGDDLRQDQLTLQLLRIMDSIWLNDNIDCRLKPYRCIATGVNQQLEGVGMIEVVMDSDTTSGIQLKYGGGAIGALKMDPIDLFLKAHNPVGSPYELAVTNFLRSCAGYCVATFVLGIGDRHNGNIMVTKDGHLFHIDFGHFLGNFKKKFGFNRERAAFVFTPEMAFVMGGKKYKKSPLFKEFKDLCCKAFNSLRKQANILENLFILMISAGMPELSSIEDVHYLRDMLLLDLSDRDAEQRFKDEIKKSLDTTWRRIDNWIHNAKHGA